jgi:hypothetical protein
LYNSIRDLTRKALVAGVPVDGGCRGRVVRVRGIDQHVVEWDPGRLLDPVRSRIQDVALDHEDITGDERDLRLARVRDHDSAGAELTFLPVGFSRNDPATDDHRIVGREHFGGRARPELAGCARALWGERQHCQQS